MSGAALLLGHLAGVAVLAVVQGTVFLGVGLHRGARVRGRPAPAPLVIAALTVLTALGVRRAGHASSGCARAPARRCRASSR